MSATDGPLVRATPALVDRVLSTFLCGLSGDTLDATGGRLVRAIPEAEHRVSRRLRLRRRAERRWIVSRVRRAFDLGITSLEEVHAEGCPALCTCRVGVRFTKDSYAIVHRRGCAVRAACTCEPHVRVNHILDDGSMV